MTPTDRARLQFAAMIQTRSPFHAATIRRSVQAFQPMKAKRMSAMNADETLPEIPAGFRQLESVALLQPGDRIFGQYLKTWREVKPGDQCVANSAGNCGITIRPVDRAADPEVLALRRATTNTHGRNA
jgi:hypothetical protein